MKKLYMALMGLVLALSANDAQAQTRVDHWLTEDACRTAVNNNAHLFYYPVIKKAQKLGKNEAVAGNPSIACVYMNVPDRKGDTQGNAWVALEPGRRLVYKNGVPDRLEECNNKIYELAPVVAIAQRAERGDIGPVGPQGFTGPQGIPGRDGSSWKPGKKTAIAAGILTAAGIACAIWCPGSSSKSESSSTSTVCVTINSQEQCSTPSASVLPRQRSFGVSIPFPIF